MTFIEYLNRPVYKAQVHTFNILRELLFLPGGALVTSGDHPIAHFRVLPQYRNATSAALRNAVAARVRESRRNGTYKLKPVEL